MLTICEPHFGLDQTTYQSNGQLLQSKFNSLFGKPSFILLLLWSIHNYIRLNFQNETEFLASILRQMALKVSPVGWPSFWSLESQSLSFPFLNWGKKGIYTLSTWIVFEFLFGLEKELVKSQQWSDWVWDASLLFGQSLGPPGSIWPALDHMVIKSREWGCQSHTYILDELIYCHNGLSYLWSSN